MVVSNHRIEVSVHNAEFRALGYDGTYDIHDLFRFLQDLQRARREVLERSLHTTTITDPPSPPR